jgi:pseudoazurin
MPETASVIAAAPKIKLSEGSEHVVKMLNSGAEGAMVFEPAVIKVSIGDTIHFKAVDMSHNSASLEGMMPEGASAWSGQMNKDISVKLDSEGVYVYQCDPHAMMAMVGVIQVGEAINLSAVKEAAASKKSSFIMNSSRLETYLSQL